MLFYRLYNFRQKMVFSGAVIAALASLWHLLCIWGGPSWFEFARAPKEIIISAQQGTWLAPVGTIIVAGLMFSCTLFAFSLLGLIRNLPLRKTAILTIAILCLLRGLVVIPFAFKQPELVDLFMVISSLVWFFVGVCFACGSYESFQVKTQSE